MAVNLKLLNYPIPSALWDDLCDAKPIHSLALTPANV
jgi:hypothetical protein